MQDILNKYYEFFISNIFTDKDNTKNDKEFYELYKIITNQYDLTNENYAYDKNKGMIYNIRNKYKPLKNELDVFFEFFDMANVFGSRRPGMYSSSKLVNKETEKYSDYLKERFEREQVSFNWFKSSTNFVKNDDFVYSIKNTKNIFCKAYLSIKPEKYIEVMIKLQEFIDKLYENHPDEEIGECKFRKVPANDAIVLRFASREHYEEFLNFLDENPEITDSFDTPNLFIPRDEHGISILPDQNSSYNYFVTKMLWDYMFECKEKNINVSVDGLCDFITNFNCLTPEIMDKCNESVIESFKDILIGKLSSKPDSELLSFMNEKGKKM